MSAFQVTSEGIVGGKYLDKYGKRGVKNKFGMPILSPPIKIENAPKGTVCFAMIMEDEDAIPVCGFSFIHWLATDFSDTFLAEGVSGKGLFPEGRNDYGDARSGSDCARYGGMGPPQRSALVPTPRLRARSKDRTEDGLFLRRSPFSDRGARPCRVHVKRRL